MVLYHNANVLCSTVIRLHSSAAYPTHRSPIFTPSFSASQRCLNAVESIVALCACIQENSLLTKLGPTFAFSLWVAARVLLVHGSTIDHRVDHSINLLVSTLRDIGQYWEVGTRYGNLLSRVLHEVRIFLVRELGCLGAPMAETCELATSYFPRLLAAFPVHITVVESC
jgi:hypothetical protein